MADSEVQPRRYEKSRQVHLLRGLAQPSLTTASTHVFGCIKSFIVYTRVKLRSTKVADVDCLPLTS